MRWIFDIITVIGFLLTGFGSYLSYVSYYKIEDIKDTLVSFCLLMTTILAIGWYHFFHKAMILKSVHNGRNHIDEALSMIMELEHNHKNKTHVEKGIIALSEICQEVSHGMRKYHSPEISICIHYTNTDTSGRHYVNTLCRNTESRKRPKKRPKSNAEHDYFSENTDFAVILEKSYYMPIDQLFYINNFLPLSPYYRNSHFSEHMRKKYYSRFGWIARMYNWELPYKSTLVVPLVFSDNNRDTIVGFLSLDSPKMWSFSITYDLPIVQSIATAMAPIVFKYNSQNLLDK